MQGRQFKEASASSRLTYLGRAQQHLRRIAREMLAALDTDLVEMKLPDPADLATETAGLNMEKERPGDGRHQAPGEALATGANDAA